LHKGYWADIDIDGFQTIKRMQAEVRSIGIHKIGFFCKSYRPDNRFTENRPGDLLFELDRRSAPPTRVIWGKYSGLIRRSSFVPDDFEHVPGVAK
jgi:hypothetical protein